MIKTNRDSKCWHHLLVIYAILLLFLAYSNIVSAQIQGDDSIEYAKLLSKVQTLGSIRIIAKLNVTFQPEGNLSKQQEVFTQRFSISRAQEDLLGILYNYNVRSVKRFRYIPYIAMEVDSRALSLLISHPLVISIKEDVPVPPTLSDSIPLINADDVWSAGYTGLGWSIAILDTGVDKTHSFFSNGKVLSEACFSTSSATYALTTLCPNGQDSQIGPGAGKNCYGINGCDHGTHVAGIAAGKSNTINGVAKDSNIISIQVFSRFDSEIACGEGNSPCILSFPSDQILGLEHVYDLSSIYNIASVNMSLGGGAYSDNCDNDPMKPAIDNLRSAGIVTVVAAGNNGYCNAIGSPACISTAVSVGATTKSDHEADYNNYAPILSLFAPGSSIYSSVPGSWAYKSGTSMAAPHVAGAWAVLKQKSPTASVSDILNSFQTTGVPIANACGGSGYYPQPRIDVLAALNSLVVPSGTLQGMVNDALFKKPILQAMITLSPYYRAYTNPDGFYQFLNLPAGTYDITVSAKRFTSLIVNGVPITEGNTTIQDFFLTCDVFFGDVPPGSWSENYIKSMYCREITNGCSQVPLNFCPYKTVTRGVIAVFLIRAMGETPSSVAYNAYFDDIANDILAPYINRLYELGITKGCGTRKFCPNNIVKRGPLAVLIIRALGETPSSVAYNAYFDDVANDWFAPYINRLYELGITRGCGTRKFCPYRDVTREQVAAFIIRAF